MPPSQASTPTPEDEQVRGPARAVIALLGNPNTGKTTLSNRLCGLRSKTANMPGSTVEAKIGTWTTSGVHRQLIDLPGFYGLHLDRPESTTCRAYLHGELEGMDPPGLAIVVVDATNLQRNLHLVNQVLQEGLPAVVAVNFIDVAHRRGIDIDTDALSSELGCPVVSISGRTGEGITELEQVLEQETRAGEGLPDPGDSKACNEWSEQVVARCLRSGPVVGHASDRMTERLDAAFTHPVLGVLAFAAIMLGLFYSIFALATLPMDLIEVFFGGLGSWVQDMLPAGWIRDLLVDGVIAGIAGTLVFLPQICLLFFLITILEDTGYLARAAFVLDRILRRFGLPGHAFVPLLSSHACAIPAIMSARMVPGRLDRLATILIAPFMSCSARLPVYVLLIGMLLADQPFLAGLVFAGCYVLGALTGLLSSALLRRTILRGPSPPMVIELPEYRLPSIRTALITTFDRGMTFLRMAGTMILGISLILWWLSAFPTSAPPAEAVALQQQAEAIVATDSAQAEALQSEADQLTSRSAVEHSFAGKIGRTIQPAFEPLGFDWQLSIGVLTSYAAREVFVSTMAILFTGMDDAEDETVLERITSATRSDGTPVFTTTTCATLLVFFVLAMQCLPTLVVTAREAGHWGWAVLQFAWMSGIAYIAALVVRLIMVAGGVP